MEETIKCQMKRVLFWIHHVNELAWLWRIYVGREDVLMVRAVSSVQGVNHGADIGSSTGQGTNDGSSVDGEGSDVGDEGNGGNGGGTGTC
jgi:hypothetical protein